MNIIAIELASFVAVAIALKAIQSQKLSNSVAIPVRVDENLRKLDVSH